MRTKNDETKVHDKCRGDEELHCPLMRFLAYATLTGTMHIEWRRGRTGTGRVDD